MTREEAEKKLRERHGAHYDRRNEITAKYLHEKLGHLTDDERQLIWDAADYVGLANDFDFIERLGDMAATYYGESIPTPSRSPDPQPVEAPPALEAPKQEAKQLSPEKEARLAEFKNPESETYRRWVAGDRSLNDERIALFSEKQPGQVEITSS